MFHFIIMVLTGCLFKDDMIYVAQLTKVNLNPQKLKRKPILNI